MNNNWCTCAEFNAKVQENYDRRVRAEVKRQAARKAQSDRYYKRVVRRHRVKTMAKDLSLIAAMAVAMFVLLRLVIYCL